MGLSMFNGQQGDFAPKGAKQFGHSSQDLDFEYKKYLLLLF
jgi:hypothetical protein